MSIFSSALNAQSLHALLTHELHDLYDGEFQIIDALPHMIEAATDKDLKKALHDHLRQTQDHVTRLEKCFQLMKEEPARMTCDGMKGIIKEGEHVLKGNMDPAVKDDALIGAAQRVEHYEMAGYGTAREHAKFLGYADVASILDQTLDEEGAADKLLTSIAKSMHKELAAVA
jgi:ferritin-like metal-binding protein YciE